MAPMTDGSKKPMSNRVKPGFYLQQTRRSRHKKQSDYVVEQSSHQSLCFDSKLALSLVSIRPGFHDSKLHDNDTKNKAIMCLSSHPSH